MFGYPNFNVSEKESDMKMKRLLIATLVGSILVAQPGYAQWAVIDAANLGQAVQQVAAWGKQLTEMRNQLMQAKATFDSINGARGMQNLVNNPALRKYLPPDYQTLLSGGYGSSAAIRAKMKVFGIEKTKLSPNSDAAKAFEKTANQAALNQATGEAAYTAASKRFDDIQVLLNKVGNAPQAKDMQDLQGRIQAEQVMLQNETVKLQMMAQLHQSQKDLGMQQAAEIRMKSTKGEIPRF
jgi:type IV secretion system protein VirB5